MCDRAAPNYISMSQTVLKMIEIHHIYRHTYKYTHTQARNRRTDTALPLLVHLRTLYKTHNKQFQKQRVEPGHCVGHQDSQ